MDISEFTLTKQIEVKKKRLLCPMKIVPCAQ